MDLHLSSNIIEWLLKPNSPVGLEVLRMAILHIYKVLYLREEWARHHIT